MKTANACKKLVILIKSIENLGLRGFTSMTNKEKTSFVSNLLLQVFFYYFRCHRIYKIYIFIILKVLVRKLIYSHSKKIEPPM